MKKFTVIRPWFLSIAVLFALSCTNPGAKKAKVEQRKGCCAPEVSDRSWYSSGKKAPLFDGLEGIHFPITTASKEAQTYFNQGFMLSYAFNHAEAARSFFEATRQDPKCAMAWWGYAYVLGPNYNAGMEQDNFKRAYDAWSTANKLSANCTPLEKALIRALGFRYSKDTNAARPPLDSAYAQEMKKVYTAFPANADVGALYAESLMDLHPWNLWQKDGKIQPWTPEIVSVLEKCLKQEPKHAGANHFYIHAMEMSLHAESALASAELLLDLVPGAGHLVHMPSHTYIRIGRYHDGVIANTKAVAVDSTYTEACHAQDAYPLAYYPHNYHFIAACATLCGESKTAMKGAWETSHHSHKKLMLDPAWGTLQHYFTIPMYTALKLGLWDDLKKTKEPEKNLTYPRVVWHYTRVMLALHQKEVAKAEKHLAQMRTLMKDTNMAKLSIWGINTMLDICNIAEKVSYAEICAYKGNYNMAISLLKEAVKLEDALNYDEPPDWFFSVRHNLGAVLIDAKKYSDAIAVYEADLKTYRDNGWALKGLIIAHEKAGNKAKLAETTKAFQKAWKHADIEIKSSRIL